MLKTLVLNLMKDNVLFNRISYVIIIRLLMSFVLYYLMYVICYDNYNTNMIQREI
jgi:hypothetical protein